MRKLMCLFAFLMVVPLVSFSQAPDVVTLTLPRKDIKDILITVRQNTVQDTVDVAEKVAAIKSMMDVLKSTASHGSITIPTEYVVQYLDRQAYQVIEFERYAKEKNKALRVISELQKYDDRLRSLKGDDSQPGRYYQVAELRKFALNEFRKEEAAAVKSFSMEKEAADEAIKIIDLDENN